MKLSDIRAIKEFCESLVSSPSWREVTENLAEGEYDFEVDNVRFIRGDHINAVLADELEGDEYSLGCFRAWFIAEHMNWPIELIEAAQQGDAYAALGRAMINSGNMLEFAQAYAAADGYGHHFNHYDGGEEELIILGQTWHVFDNR